MRLPSGENAGLVVVSRVVGQRLDSAAVRAHAVEVCGAVALRGEHDPLPSGDHTGS